MAASQVHVSFPIVKFDKTPDGDLIVYGKCTDGSVDADHQIVDPKWSAKALDDWLTVGGNVRVQHSPFLYPAGKGLALELDRDGDGGHWLKALVVKDTPAHGLVEKRILKDFSVGILDPRIVFGDHRAPGGTIKGGTIGEVSLVDRGSNKNTTFQIAKSVGDGVELVAKVLSMSPMARVAIGKKKKIVDSGGRDVSDVPAQDFAGPGHTFPIKGPADVSDAASLAHHADDPAQVRDNIKRIARRKFGKDTDMPPSLDKNDDDSGSSDTCDLCNGTKKIREGNVDCPKCTKAAEPDITKADAGEDDAGETDTDTDEQDYEDDSEGTTAPDGDADPKKARVAKKALKRAVRRQRAALKADASRGDNGGRTPAGVQGKPSPGAAEAGFSRPKDKRMVPAGKHREPDGAQAEGIEADAGMHSSDESGDKTGVPGSKWSATKSHPSLTMRRLHDATCPAYRWGEVRKSYGLPRDVGAAVPVREIETLAMNAIVKGDFDEAAYFTSMLELAATMQHIGPAELLDARKALPAMFPTAHPAQQTEVRPTQFRRTYLSDGRPPLTADSTSGNSLPPAKVHEVSAQDFQRGFISSGHSSESPSGQARGGLPGFGAALSTIGEMHSKVTSLWPGMCPIDVTHRDYTTGEGQTGIKPARMTPAPNKAPGQKSTEVKLRKQLATALALNKSLQDEVDLLGSLPDPEQAPYRGLPQTGGPVDRESFVGKALGNGGAGSEAEGDEADLLEFINGLAASGDPTLRMNATKAIEALLTK